MYLWGRNHLFTKRWMNLVQVFLNIFERSISRLAARMIWESCCCSFSEIFFNDSEERLPPWSWKIPASCSSLLKSWILFLLTSSFSPMLSTNPGERRPSWNEWFSFWLSVAGDGLPISAPISTTTSGALNSPGVGTGAKTHGWSVRINAIKSVFKKSSSGAGRTAWSCLGLYCLHQYLWRYVNW